MGRHIGFVESCWLIRRGTDITARYVARDPDHAPLRVICPPYAGT